MERSTASSILALPQISNKPISALVSCPDILAQVDEVSFAENADEAVQQVLTASRLRGKEYARCYLMHQQLVEYVFDLELYLAQVQKIVQEE